MEHFFITKELEQHPTMPTLMEDVRKALMTPDMYIAARAGCTFEVKVEETKTGMVVKMSTREKVSILRFPDGRPVSIFVDRNNETGRL